MIKRIAFAAALSSLLGGAALAQAPAPAQLPPPAATTAQAEQVESSDDCLKIASDLAQAAESKQLAEDKLDKIEDLLIKMETHCDAKQFNEAQAVAADIKTIIDAQ